MTRGMGKDVSGVPAIEPAANPADVAALARRLLDAVERGELVADDSAGRRVVSMWRVLATPVHDSDRGVDTV